ncbi:hypothetical protein N7535_003652 [Penicillium sp. DV-2018c]|nr:hypothetical protein N7535_003652 [Penicillium sp. DV-2018c]
MDNPVEHFKNPEQRQLAKNIASRFLSFITTASFAANVVDFTLLPSQAEKMDAEPHTLTRPTADNETADFTRPQDPQSSTKFHAAKTRSIYGIVPPPVRLSVTTPLAKSGKG